MRNISNSEVTTFLSCRRMYVFAFGEGYGLEPKVMSVPLFRGNVGHEAFQRYAEARCSGDSHEKSLQAGQDVFPQAMRANPNLMDTVMETKFLWDRYMAFHKGWPEWRLHEPEQKFDLKLTDDFKITIRYDAKVEEIKSGRILMGDYKFTYDFWTPEEHELNGQMPKYIAVMQANGLRIDGGFLEEIRTRNIKDDPKKMWRRTHYYPTAAKKMNMLKQHIAASFEITEFRALPKEEQMFRAIPLLSKHGACKFCNFKDLCNSMNEGKKDLSVDIAHGYQANTYGYNKEEVLAEL